METLIFYVAAFIWGALWGSFANVCIHRLPRGMSVVRPPSHCPECKSEIRWYHNIPIASYLLLGGKCAYCGKAINLRYLVVEMLLALLSLAVFIHFSHDPNLEGVRVYELAAFLYYFVMAFILLVITFIDIIYFVIPNVFSLVGIVFALSLSPMMSPFTGITFLESVIGAVAGGGIMLVFIYTYKLITRREGMGGGDFKLMAMSGAFLGWKALPFILFASSVQGILFALVVRISGKSLPPPEPYGVEQGEDEEFPEPPSDGFRHMMLPYGPFIALSAFEFLIIRSKILEFF